MDVEAVSHATDDVLEALGLVKTGDRVSLQAFCKMNPVTEEAREHKEDKKRSLLEAFLSRKKKEFKHPRGLFPPIQLSLLKRKQGKCSWVGFTGMKKQGNSSPCEC